MTVASDWRDHLSEEDKAEVAKWVQQSGLERVARIIAVMADGEGERGRPVRPDADLLRAVAKVKLQDRTKSTDAIAAEIVHKNGNQRRPIISPKSLIEKLRKDFADSQYSWEWLVGQTQDHKDRQRHNSPASHIEDRVLARIIEVMPEALNLYGALLSDAKRLGPDKVAQIEQLGKARCEKLLAKRLQEQMGKVSGRQNTKIPRNFFDLIVGDL